MKDRYSSLIPTFVQIGFFCFLSIHLTSCNSKQKKLDSKDLVEIKSSVKYAKGFDIVQDDKGKKLVIYSPYPGAETPLIFEIGYEGESQDNKIVVPLKKVIATSTTHIPMMELLGVSDRLVGFPNTQYICSENVMNRVDKGLVTDVGNGQEFNMEIIFALGADAVIGNSMGAGDKKYEVIKRRGIPVIFNGEWLEESPLGRAEWIKFFGVLFDKERQADSLFSDIEARYLEVKDMAHKADSKPRIFSGNLFKDQWHLPAGESFKAKLYDDANMEYIWGDSEGQASLVLSFESVFEKAKDADLWIGAGYHTSYSSLRDAHRHYENFDSFANKRIYTFSKRNNGKGGVLYFELAPVRPDIVLKDLVKTAHPQLLPDYEPFFLSPLDD